MDKRVLPDLIAMQARRHGARELVRFEEGSWTFETALEIAMRRAAVLHRSGIRAGDRVALMISNRPEFLDLFFGCAWLGAVAVPINVASRGMQLQHILSNSGARLLVMEDAFAEALAGLDVNSLAVETVWIVGDRGSVDHPGSCPLPCLDDAILPAAKLTAADLVAIIYTSGTTGPSKGVCCPHAQLYWWGANTAEILELGDGESLFTSLPLFHVNALNTVYQALITGSTVILGKRFSASGLWPALVEHGATVTYLLGAMVPILLSQPERSIERDHSVRIALGPGVPSRFHEPFRQRFGFSLIEGYGSTETNFVIAGRPGDGVSGSMGRLRPGFEAKIVDSADAEVASGEPGELVLRASEPFAFSSGYFAMPEKTVEAWRNLWFHTGDRVLREEDGSFRFVDRMKDAIRRRGENVSSYEVEQVLLAHTSIASAAVFPVRSEMAEEEVMAAVIPASGSSIDHAELIAFCRPRLSYFAIPRFIDVVDALPTTENGKVRKHVLTERGVTASTWDREAHGIPAR